MKTNGRFSVALHVLLHLAETPEEPSTSERLAGCVGTNPVVIRRTLAGLREAGLVSSIPGHGGGWLLARPAGKITLRQVYAALGDESLLRIDIAGREHPDCLVERAVAGALDDFIREAQAILVERLDGITLSALASRTHATRRTI